MPVNPSASVYSQPRLPVGAPKARITIGTGTPSEKSWNLRRPVTMIGSRRTSHILLRHPEVSKAHCLVLNTGSHVIARDLNSRTGSILNNESLSLAQLREGDVLKIGPMEIHVSVQPAEHAPEVDPIALPFKAELRRRDGTERWELTRVVTLVGRKPDSDVCLDHDDVSLAHAVVCFSGGRLAVFDLGSRTGTWVDDQQTHYGVLKDGDVLRIGPLELEIAIDAPAGDEGASDECELHEPEPDGMGVVQLPAELGTTEPTDASEPLDDEVVPLDLGSYDGQDIDGADAIYAGQTSGPGMAPTGGLDSDPEEFVDEFEVNLAVFQQNLAQSANRLSDWQSRLVSQTAALKQFNQEVSQRETIVAAREREIASREESIRLREEEVTKRDQEVRAREEGFADSQRALDERAAEIERGSSELEQAKQEAERARAQAQTEIDERRKALEESEAALEARRAHFAEESRHIETLKAELDRQRQELDKQRGELDAQTQSFAEERKAITSATEQLETERASLAAAAEELETDRAEFTEEVNRVESELTEKRAALDEAARQFDAQRRDVEAQTARLEEAFNRLKAESESSATARREIDELAEQLGARSAELDAREQAIAQQQEALRKEREAFERESATMRRQAILLQQAQHALAEANAVFASGFGGAGVPEVNVLKSPAQIGDAPSAAFEAPVKISFDDTESMAVIEEPFADSSEAEGNAERQSERNDGSGPGRSGAVVGHVDASTDGVEELAERDPASDELSEADRAAGASMATPGSELDLDAETRDELRMLRRMGAKGSDAELLTQLHARNKKNRPGENGDAGGKKRRWWSR